MVGSGRQTLSVESEGTVFRNNINKKMIKISCFSVSVQGQLP